MLWQLDPILKWISNGPNRDEIKARKGKNKPPSEEEIELYVKNWQLMHLARMHRSLPDEWKARYNELKLELGEPEHPEFLSYKASGFVGPTSPKKSRRIAVDECHGRCELCKKLASVYGIV
jgi:hypothetical protein